MALSAPALGTADALGLLEARATRFKMRASLSLSDAVRHDDVSSAAAASLALPGIGADIADAVARLFFSGAEIAIGCGQSQTPVVGFYSPVFDAWWVSLWNAEGTIVEGLFTTAPLFVPDAADAGRLPWLDLRAQDSFIGALQGSSRAAYADFRSEFARSSAAMPAAFARIDAGAARHVQIRSRAARIATGIAAFANDGAAYRAYQALTAALSAPAPPPPPNLAPDAAAAFAYVARSARIVRARLVPIAALRAGDVWLTISANPASGRTLVLAAIDSTRAQPILRLGLLDFLAGGVL